MIRTRSLLLKLPGYQKLEKNIKDLAQFSCRKHAPCPLQDQSERRSSSLDQRSLIPPKLLIRKLCAASIRKSVLGPFTVTVPVESLANGKQHSCSRLSYSV